jgi:hypothetical protein
MTMTARYYNRFQADNPEGEFNEDLINWRERDDACGYLEDIFAALEVVQGIHLEGVEIVRDESAFPRDLSHNDVETNRLDLARVSFRIEHQGAVERITLSIFLPKLIDGLFYVLNGNLYYPILQLVDRRTYVTRSTFTLKTLLMPIIFRRDTEVRLEDQLDGAAYQELIYVLELFRNRINVLRYFMASKGLGGTMEFFGMAEDVAIVVSETLSEEESAEWRVHQVQGQAGLSLAARRSWVEADPHYRGAMLATLADALAGVPRRDVEEDDAEQWKKRLGKHFTQNPNSYLEKAERITVSLERILDRRTKRNLTDVADSDKENIYCILRWMMREYRTLSTVDGMDIRNRRIRMSEYMIHPLLIRFSESTYRLLNSKTLSMRSLLGIFRPFMTDEDGTRSRPQVGFLVKKLVSNELLRYANMVNSFDLLLALRWTARGPQGLADRGKSDVSLRLRGHHPSYVGRVDLASSSASDPGTSGTFCPWVKTEDQFIL